MFPGIRMQRCVFSLRWRGWQSRWALNIHENWSALLWQVSWEVYVLDWCYKMHILIIHCCSGGRERQGMFSVFCRSQYQDFLKQVYRKITECTCTACFNYPLHQKLLLAFPDENINKPRRSFMHWKCSDALMYSYGSYWPVWWVIPDFVFMDQRQKSG